ncbi:class I SAM-dependent methyltransferase [Streptomyces sp. NL15-2K]|uniref:class I SAM-dependent methyltransferase n=1 Tax=Streptomyces sp. NL15-2K TaxID=376149 RepID=UPI000F58903A|nr:MULTISPECIES: class I SAM-dependent methyltransferase [Actinomycetes]WKX14997.1 class I SAM-dependent methyltransferase [Kutzneria buriramensis]GCB51935.1 methyltransferase [Streptomyces sp. NL15-2K]
MDGTRKTDGSQASRWNGPAGHTWVEAQTLLDEMLRPFEDLLVEAVMAEHPGHVLDVGCGTGSTTLAVARRLGPAEQCVGIDISEPMITAARARAEREGARASFIRADAQDHAFEPATFDAIISRFGVMFFNDSVQAFANLRRAARDEARLCCITWRSPAENPFMTTAERAAAPFLPDLPTSRPEEPGRFAFADSGRVHRILAESGWTGIDIRPIDVPCTLPERELVRYFTRFGPLGLILDQADEKTRAQVVETVRAAFDPYVQGTEVRFTAACWMVGARAQSVSAAKLS